MRALVWSLLAVAAVGLAAGCAEPVKDLNLVQPDYVKKDQFQGDWYYRQAIVRASPEQSVAYVGIEGSLEKIHWVITEDTLYAYRTHEVIKGLDEDDDQPGAKPKGDPVAAFPIQSHFDIKRGYNASTGEETNVINENHSDRPWYEREYMRIDWGKGLMGGFADLGFVKVDAQRGDYVRPTEAFNPDQLQVTDDYIQITQQVGVTDYGETCYYEYGDYNCGSSEVSLRLSFAKIQPEDEFEPRPYLDNVPLYGGQCSVPEIRQWLKAHPSFQSVADKALRGRPLGYDNFKDVCVALAEESAKPEYKKPGFEAFQDGEIIRTVTLTLNDMEHTALEFACTPDLLDILNQQTAPGTWVARDSCSQARYSQADRFGFFRTERHVFDRRVGGGNDNLREYYANIHDVWSGKVSRDVFRDADGNVLPTNDKGEALDADGKVLPHNQDGVPVLGKDAQGKDILAQADTIETRIPKPIVYYVNVDYPDDLNPVTVRISQDWNAAFMEMAVASTRLDALDRSWLKGELKEIQDKVRAETNSRKDDLTSKQHDLQTQLDQAQASWEQLKTARPGTADADELKKVAKKRLDLTDEIADVTRELDQVANDATSLQACPAGDVKDTELAEKALDPGCAGYLKRVWITQQLHEAHDKDTKRANDLFLVDDTSKYPGYGPDAFFQLRANTCSVRGVNKYLERNPEMKDIEQQAIGGADLSPGNVERVCAGLMHYSREREVEPFTWQQLGDVRYSFVNWINDEQPAGPLGLGPSAADPENGHIVSGNANIYGAALDAYARASVDVLRAMNEDEAIDQVINGENIAEWVDGTNTGKTVADMEQGLTVSPAKHAEMMRRRGGAFDVEHAYGQYHLPDGSVDTAAVVRSVQHRLHNPDPSDPIARVMSAPVDEGQARLERIKQDPDLRALLVDSDTQEAAWRLSGWKPGDDVTPEMDDAAVDLAVDRQAFRKRMEERFKFLTQNKHGCVFMADFLDDSVIGAALEMKGLDPEYAYQRLRALIYRAVTLHELGHTVGLTHNFAGSFDAVNYPDEFWKIQERFPDASQRAERSEAKQPEFRYSSIMDYGSRFNSDIHGLGRYDHAAIKFVYGNAVEEFAPEVPVHKDVGYEALVTGYEAIPDALGGAQNIAKRVDRPIADQIEARRRGVFRNTELLLANADPSDPSSPYLVNREVPYGYCIDIYEGNLTCRVFDEGANHTEAVESAIQRYWQYYAFNAYRRGRNEATFINSYLGRQNSLGEYLTYPFKYYFFYQDYDVGLRNDLYRAARLGLNFIDQVLGTPLPGRHCLDVTRNEYVPYSQVDDPDMRANCDTGRTSPNGDPMALDIPVGVGRDQLMKFNDDYDYKVEYMGWYLDKFNVLGFLADTRTSFFQVANLGDSRQFSIGFYRAFRPELVKLMNDLLHSVIEGDVADSFSGIVDNDEQITPRALIDGADFGQGPEQMAGRPRVYSPMSYNMLWRGLLLMSVFNTSSYDSQLDFSEYLTIAEKGSGEDRDYGPNVPVVEFTNPASKVVYRAAQTDDGQSIAYDLLTRMNDFVANTWQPAKDAVSVPNPSAAAKDAFQRADHKLGEYIDLVSGIRRLRAATTF